MSMGIERQSDQYGAFTDDPGIYASRDRNVFDVPDGVPQYLASMGPAIATGLNNTRQASPYTGRDPAGDPRDLYGDGHDYEAEARENQGYYGEEAPGREPMPPEDPYAGHDPHQTPVQPLDQFLNENHPDDFSHYHNAEPPGHFSQARRRTADDGGSDLQAFNPNLYSPGDRLDAKSQLHGGDPERWLTAANDPSKCSRCRDTAFWAAHENLIEQGKSHDYADKHAEADSEHNFGDMTCNHGKTAASVAPSQPAAPAEPVWLGHAYVPGHRVGMDWRGRTLPGTVTHLEGTDLGVRWDDGQFSTENAGAIKPLY